MVTSHFYFLSVFRLFWTGVLSGRLSTESQIIAKPTCYGKGVCTEECCPNSGERKRQVVAEINEKTISLYPNPVHNQINLTGSAELVQVCDGMGRIVADLQNVNVIECGDWPKGLYFVLVSDKGAFKQYRVVVE